MTNVSLLIATTVPETLALILKSQPRFLSQFFDVSLVTSNGEYLDLLSDEEVPIYLVSMARKISPLRDVIAILKMVGVIRKIKPDILHSYTPKAGLVCMVAGYVCNVPVRIHTFTGLLWPTASRVVRHLLIIADKIICGFSTHIVAEGEGISRDLRGKKITRKKIEVVGHGNIAGVDTIFFDPELPNVVRQAEALRDKLGIRKNEFVFLFIGRLHRDKGISELVDAFLALPGMPHLLIVGNPDPNGALDSAVHMKIQSNDRIHLVGFLFDVRPALRAADIFVFPSYREGFPNALLQAGAMRLPAIATDINGCNEILQESENGWLVPVKDTPTLIRAMARTMSVPKQLKILMGDYARQRVVERFERQRYLQELIQFYRSLNVN